MNVSPVSFRSPPAELLIYARTISDDDLCAWCCHLWYQPGEESVCEHHAGPHWPGTQDEDGYIQRCAAWSPAQENVAP